MRELHADWNQRAEKSDKADVKQTYDYLHSLADKSVRIESILNSRPVSYLNLQHVLKEAVKYRPSKTSLQNALRSLLEAQTDGKLKIDEFNYSDVRVFRADSTLSPDIIALNLNKLANDDRIYLLFNTYKNTYYITSKKIDLKKDERAKQALDQFQKNLSSKGFKIIRSEPIRNSVCFKLK